MQYNKSFYEKHGIKVTDNPINYNKTAEQTQLENSLREVTMGNSVTLHTVKLIEQAIDKYPDSEALKNYLYAAYIKTGQPDKGFACLNNTLQQHPDYAFGVINLANYHLQKGELDKAAEFLTKPYDVYRIEKEEYIHDSVFISYYQAVVRLALANYDMKTAQKYHRMMFDYNPTNQTVKEISGEILRGRFSSIAKRMVAPTVRNVEAPPKAIEGWKASKKLPVFIHPEVQQLYNIDAKNMPETVINQLLNLPRETFIQDLENILADMVRRRYYHLNRSEWAGETMSFPLHALYFLTELRAYDSLPAVLNILRQDKKLLEYWFSNGLSDYFLPTLYILGNNQLPLLKKFVLEPHNYHWSREIVTELAAQTVLRQPERRVEIVTWFKDIITTHLDQSDNDGLIDNAFFSGMMGDILDFKGIELEQEITALFEKGWIRLFVCGDLEDVLEHLNAPKETQFSRVRDLPASIFERYTGKYTDKIEQTPIVRLPTDNVEDPYNSFLLQQTFGRLMDPPQKKISQADDSKKEDFDDRPKLQETVRRVESKIGRNDPCPCGSGKKYKKCHGA